MRDRNETIPHIAFDLDFETRLKLYTRNNSKLKAMRDLTPDEQNLWLRVTGSITPMGAPRKMGFEVPYQIVNSYPSWVLDLHGFKVYDAFQAVKAFVEDAYLASARRVTIVTGKSGVIRKEFPDWVDRYPVHRCELLIGGGAYRVFLCKKPQKSVNPKKT